MRNTNVFAAIACMVCFTAATAQEALPLVQPRSSGSEAASPSSWSAADRSEPTIFLAVDPIRNLVTTAPRAVTNPDVLMLDHYAATDPNGAFFGREMRDRLARTNPGFAAYIEDYRIVDSRGNAFYPTAESRAWLIEHGTARGSESRTLVAESQPASRHVANPAKHVVRHHAKSHPASHPAAKHVAPKPSAKPKSHHRRLRKASLKPAPSVQQATAKSIPSQVQPLASQTTPVPASTPPVAQTAASSNTIAQSPRATAIDTTSTPVIPQPSAALPVQNEAADPSKTSRHGIFFIIAALIGIGVMTMMLRTPRRDPAPAADSSPYSLLALSETPVPSAPPETSKSESDARPVKTPGRRATGSRG